MTDFIRDLVSCSDLDAALREIIAHFRADSGTIHLRDADGQLRLKCSAGIPENVLERIALVPVGKGMAGLAALRREPVGTCNIQTDATGDVRPGARATGLGGAVVVPMFGEDQEVFGTLGIGTRSERTFSEQENELLIECGRALAQRVKTFQ